MEPDLALVLGLVIAAFSVPSILSALADSRAPRASALTVLIGGGLILYALQQNPNGYTMQGIPDVFVRVFARFLP
ncbi:hypothetical protein [uncultured Sulfitobacter sp.]|uniref:hypothetical protein n=1 Tax=uncultured Sulfitobacter sp. TaxID=191468 RepID=UPI00261539EC|nr:hypothetical protein [uncultured Sulfitobacter sp.]